MRAPPFLSWALLPPVPSPPVPPEGKEGGSSAQLRRVVVLPIVLYAPRVTLLLLLQKNHPCEVTGYSRDGNSLLSVGGGCRPSTHTQLWCIIDMIHHLMMNYLS